MTEVSHTTATIIHLLSYTGSHAFALIKNYGDQRRKHSKGGSNYCLCCWNPSPPAKELCDANTRTHHLFSKIYVVRLQCMSNSDRPEADSERYSGRLICVVTTKRKRWLWQSGRVHQDPIFARLLILSEDCHRRWLAVGRVLEGRHGEMLLRQTDVEEDDAGGGIGDEDALHGEP